MNDWKQSKSAEIVATILVVLIVWGVSKAVEKQDPRTQISDVQEVGIQKIQKALDSLELRRLSVPDFSRTDVCTIRELYIKYREIRDEYDALNLPLYAFLTRNIHADTRMLAEQFYIKVFALAELGAPIICNPGFETQILEDADAAMKEYMTEDVYARRHPVIRQAFVKAVTPLVEQALSEYVNFPSMPREDLRSGFVGWVRRLTERWGGTAEDFGVPPMFWEQISR